MMAVELFAMNSAIKGSGLPDLESWERVFTDEECEMWGSDEESLSEGSRSSSAAARDLTTEVDELAAYPGQWGWTSS